MFVTGYMIEFAGVTWPRPTRSVYLWCCCVIVLLRMWICRCLWVLLDSLVPTYPSSISNIGALYLMDMNLDLTFQLVLHTHLWLIPRLWLWCVYLSTHLDICIWRRGICWLFLLGVPWCKILERPPHKTNHVLYRAQCKALIHGSIFPGKTSAVSPFIRFSWVRGSNSQSLGRYSSVLPLTRAHALLSPRNLMHAFCHFGPKWHIRKFRIHPSL